MDTTPLLSGLPRDLASGVLQPPLQPPTQASAARADELRSSRSSSDLVEEAEPTSWWSKCSWQSCCGPRRVAPAIQASVTRSEREPAGPPTLPTAIDMESPEGVALAQLAGGIWVTQTLSRLWPHLAGAVEGMVTDMFPGLVEANKPTWMEGVTLDRFTLGKQVPVVQNVHVDQVDDDDVSEVRLQLELAWQSDSDIQLTVKPLPTVLNSMMPTLLKGVVEYMTSLTVGVQGLSIQAQLLITLGPLDNALPVVKAMQVSMLRTPDINFNITLTRGESTILNVLKPWLRTLIASAFVSYVVPEHIAVPIEPNMPDMQKPEGVLMVRVVRAENVPKMDYWGHSDTYVDAWVRGRIKRRTPVIKKEANPEWNEDASFIFLVHTRRFQVLSFELWDEDVSVMDATDDLIGAASLRLVDLQPGKEHELSLQVVNASSGPASEDAPPGLDPAHAGGRSTVDVSNTRLVVRVRYVPAALAPLLADEVGAAGVFNIKLSKVTVPDLALLPLKARPYIVRQRPVTVPPLSRALYPLTGKDPVTGDDLSEKRELPLAFDAVWDVLGTPEEVAGCIFVLEMVSGAGTKTESIAARIDVPLANIISKRIPNVPGGMAGGSYTLRSETGFEFDMQLLWSPLLTDNPAAVSAAASGSTAVGLQALLPHSTTTPSMGSHVTGGTDPASAHGFQPSKSMPAVSLMQAKGVLPITE